MTHVPESWRDDYEKERAKHLASTSIDCVAITNVATRKIEEAVVVVSRFERANRTMQSACERHDVNQASMQETIAKQDAEIFALKSRIDKAGPVVVELQKLVTELQKEIAELRGKKQEVSS